MHDNELSMAHANIDSLRERVIDTAKYLKGIAAVVEGLNKGAGDGLEVAIRAVEAVAEDLGKVLPRLSLDGQAEE